MQKLGKGVWFRADAAFVKPDIYEALEELGVKYAIRIPVNDCLLRDIAGLLIRPVGRISPSCGTRASSIGQPVGRRAGDWSNMRGTAG